jgi:ATP-dependent Clp protease ATP-binding subunit ClpB
LSAVGTAAARKKFTPEFVNRLDAMVVFHALGEAELRQIAEIELRRVQQRIFNSGATPFLFRVTEAALEQVLVEGTDPRYGARHLRRAIDRLLVQPISNLLATEQVRKGDWVRIDADPESREMVFLRVGPPSSDTFAGIPTADSSPPSAVTPAGIKRRFNQAVEFQAA